MIKYRNNIGEKKERRKCNLQGKRRGRLSGALNQQPEIFKCVLLFLHL
jgi:hypothetical protein